MVGADRFLAGAAILAAIIGHTWTWVPLVILVAEPLFLSEWSFALDVIRLKFYRLGLQHCIITV